MFKKFAVGLVVVLLALAPSIASAKSLSISGTAKFSTGPDTLRFNTTATGMDTLIVLPTRCGLRPQWTCAGTIRLTFRFSLKR